MAGSLIVISLAASALFVVLVVLAHILNPEIASRRRKPHDEAERNASAWEKNSSAPAAIPPSARREA